MKSLRLLLFVVLVSFSAVAFAQSDAHKMDAHKMDAGKTAAPKSEAQLSFDTIKTLAGEWEGPVDTDFPGAKEALGDKGMHLTMRVTSRGNVLVHEFQQAGTPLDATKYDHPVTMFYIDQGKFNLVHYCDAGNRPRMTGKIGADGKSFEFDFLDVAGSTAGGHMHRAGLTVINEDHHTEDWTFMVGDQPVRAHFDLQRKK